MNEEPIEITFKVIDVFEISESNIWSEDLWRVRSSAKPEPPRDADLLADIMQQPTRE